MLRTALVVVMSSVLLACPINPSLTMWDSNDRGAPNTCLPFPGDGGVGSGAVSGAINFTVAGSHHFAFSPASPNGTQFLSLELDEAGTTCHLTSQAEANRTRRSGTQLIVVQLVAPADAGWEGTYTLSGATPGARTGTASHSAATCQPFLGVLGDCATPTTALRGTVTIDAVTPCSLLGRVAFVDPLTDGGSSGTFESAYCRGID